MSPVGLCSCIWMNNQNVCNCISVKYCSTLRNGGPAVLNYANKRRWNAGITIIFSATDDRRGKEIELTHRQSRMLTLSLTLIWTVFLEVSWHFISDDWCCVTVFAPKLVENGDSHRGISWQVLYQAEYILRQLQYWACHSARRSFWVAVN